MGEANSSETETSTGTPPEAQRAEAVAAPQSWPQRLSSWGVVMGAAVSLAGVLLTAALGFETVQLSAAQQVEERFSRSVDQLGAADPSVRSGAVLALGRLADDGPARWNYVDRGWQSVTRGKDPYREHLRRRAEIRDLLRHFLTVRADPPNACDDPAEAVAGCDTTGLPPLPDEGYRTVPVDMVVAARTLGSIDCVATPIRWDRSRIAMAGLRDACFREASLSGTLWQDAQLIGADFTGAKLIGANPVSSSE